MSNPNIIYIQTAMDYRKLIRKGELTKSADSRLMHGLEWYQRELEIQRKLMTTASNK